jgi:hypothetical protein
MVHPTGTPGAGPSRHTRARGRPPGRTGRAVRARRVANWVNLATPLGLLLARYGRCELSRGPYGVILAKGYARSFPPVRNRAMTIGDVVLLGISDEQLARRPHLLEHEARHCGQYAYCLGPLLFLPAYGLASAWSWLHTRNPAHRNIFEVRAGLVEGGYLKD